MAKKKRRKNHDWGSISVTIDKRFTIIDRLFIIASFIAIAVFSFPQFSVAQVISDAPFIFEIQNPIYLSSKLQNLPIAEDVSEEAKLWSNNPEDIRVPILEEYLLQRRSPVAEHANLILKHKHYRLITAISFAESNFCKKQISSYNCWGIGGSRPEIYADYNEAFTRANGLIQRYQDLGMTTPKLMRNSWVGWQNDSWIVAVDQVLEDLNEIGL